MVQLIFVKKKTSFKDLIKRLHEEFYADSGTGPVLFLTFFDDSGEIKEIGRSLNFEGDKE